MSTIFIVDDDNEMREKYTKILTDEGFKVFEAADAVAVADIIMRDRSEIELVLLDINMPEVDGRGIWEIVDEYAPEIKIIVSSVLPLQDQKLKIPRAAGYFNKADDSKVLMKIINDVLGR